MNSQNYFEEIHSQLFMLFSGVLNGQKPVLETKSRLEGFMRAGVVLGIVSNAELQTMMEDIHQQVFGESVTARKLRRAAERSEEEIDYGQFESPSITRVK